MTYLYDLRLGLPHTNYRGFSEPLLLMQAGHFQWASIASAINRPLSSLRTSSGSEVYAAFYFIEEHIPAQKPLESFRLDDVLRFAVSIRSFKNLAVEGRVVFDRHDRLRDVPDDMIALTSDDGGGKHPWLRFGNIFITPAKGNTALKVAPPADGDFSAIPVLPNEDNPYHFTRAASQTGRLGFFDESWSTVGAPFVYRYQIDIDRDTNGAGLVYFAQYVTFMEKAERLAVRQAAGGGDIADRGRSLRRRRIAYYGNADVFDTITIRVTILRQTPDNGCVGFRHEVAREEDGHRICLSETIKAVDLA